MRSDIREEAEKLKQKISDGKATKDDLNQFVFQLDCFIEARIDSAQDASIAYKKNNNLAKEYALLRDVLKEMYESRNPKASDNA